MTLVYLALAFAAGIVFAAQFTLPLVVWAWWLVLPLGALLIWRHDPGMRRVQFCLLIFLLAALRYTIALPRLDENSLAAYNDRGTMLLVGTVVGYPDVRDRTTNLRFDVTRVRIEGVWREVSGVALLQAPRET
ncbi:MAG: DUF4131 domain-containing protein, partial [Anaerolineales bacterium]|nr:DUF4131 domain-containing protein [Anaerolineales bacterium]